VKLAEYPCGISVLGNGKHAGTNGWLSVCVSAGINSCGAINFDYKLSFLFSSQKLTIKRAIIIQLAIHFFVGGRVEFV
jgi:hypothetical protein